MSSSHDNLGPDPSMEEILSSIRRILREDEAPEEEDAPPPRQPRQPEARFDAEDAPEPAPEPQPARSHAPDPAPAPGRPTHDLPVHGLATTTDEDGNSVLILDPSMMVSEAPKPPQPRLPQAQSPQPRLSQPQSTERGRPEPAAARPMPPEPPAAQPQPSSAALAVSRGGPTLEDMVRDELRPILRAWIETHLPALVQQEVARLAAQGKL